MPSSNVLRPASWGAVLLLAVLVTGCSNSENPPAASSLPSPVAQSGTPSAPASPRADPEPSPVISHRGKAKIVTLGDTEIRAIRNESGVNVTCSVTNTQDRSHNMTVTVSAGNGKDWVTTNNFEFQQVLAGRTGPETTVMGASFEGELPDDPKISIDSVIHY